MHHGHLAARMKTTYIDIRVERAGGSVSEANTLATDWNVFHVLGWRREVPEGIRWVNSAWILTCSITRINFNTNPTVMKVSFVLN